MKGIALTQVPHLSFLPQPFEEEINQRHRQNDGDGPGDEVRSQLSRRVGPVVDRVPVLQRLVQAFEVAARTSHDSKRLAVLMVKHTE